MGSKTKRIIVCFLGKWGKKIRVGEYFTFQLCSFVLFYLSSYHDNVESVGYMIANYCKWFIFK